MNRIQILELSNKRNKIEQEYLEMKQLLFDPVGHDAETFATVAQKANDAWLELKRLDVEVQNATLERKMRQLYGA